LDMDSGRINQKLRTRNSILDAAGRLLKKQQNPTAEAIAGAAMVSRTTLYRYFPNLESLIVEASLHLQTPDAEEILAPASGDLDKRIALVQDYFYDLAVNNEPRFRQFLKATLSSWLEHNGNLESLRSGRRVAALEAALAPVKDQLGAENKRRLVVALSALTGIEALVVMRDVCEIPQEEGKVILSWAAGKLLEAAMREK